MSSSLSEWLGLQRINAMDNRLAALVNSLAGSIRNRQWLLKRPSSQDGRQPHVMLTVELLAANRIGRAARRVANEGTSSPAGKPLSQGCRSAPTTAGGTMPQWVRNSDEDRRLALDAHRVINREQELTSRLAVSPSRHFDPVL